MSEAAVPAGGPTAGELLRQAREAAGLHVATLAANLKVPVPKLEALEADRYELLPDAVFVRALASSVCRTLKVDPQPVLERLPQTVQPRLVPDTEGINAPFRAPSDAPQAGLLDQVSRPVLLTVVLLLLGALVLVFLPYAQQGYESFTQAVGSAQAPVPTPVKPPAASAGISVESVVPATAVAETVATPAVVPATDGVASPAALPAAPAPLPPATPALASLTSAPAPAATADAGSARGIVVFRTRSSSWVQVTDASGATVFRKLMEGGETAGVSGTLPLSVTVGSVEATEVEVRGKPYNLATVSKDNVARFQIK